MDSRRPLFVSIVLDGVGIGYQPDAADYGDEGADTLGHVCAAARPSLPNLGAAGLGRIADLTGVSPSANPEASWGRMQERSAGKDSTTGHWELAGLTLEDPFPTYPGGFPVSLLARFAEKAGVEGILGNEVASGTDIIARLGQAHVDSGHPIVYTSADSVFQVACHTDVVPLDTLYDWCQMARDEICTGPHAVGRVIARPFHGAVGQFERLSDKRLDFALAPEEKTLQERLQDEGIRTVSVGKVADLFAGVGFDESLKTGRNQVGIQALLDRLQAWDGTPTYIWVNLIDFDQEFGHRNNPAGFAESLEEFDRALPAIRAALPEGGGLLLTADHGNDPTHPGTDHTREFVPVLLFQPGPSVDLGLRTSFQDHAATVLSWFAVPRPHPGVPLPIGPASHHGSSDIDG